LFLAVSLAFVVIHGGVEGQDEVDAPENASLGVVDLSLFFGFIDGMQQILV
jgi:hypothetical protein